MKRSRLFLVTFLVAVLFSVSFCICRPVLAGSNSQITIAGGSVGGSWFPVASAISELLNKEMDENIASAKPGGGVSNPIMVSKGTVSAGFSYSSYLVAAKNEEDPYEGKGKLNNLKSVVVLFPMYWQILADKNLPYEYFGDIVSNKYPVKMSPTKRGHGDYWVTDKAFKFLGVDITKDIKKWGGKVELGGGGEMASLFKDRHIDLAFSHNVVPLSIFSDMSVSRESKLMKIDEKVRNFLKDNYGMREGVIPKGTYKGQDEDIETVGMPCVLFVREEIPETIVYALTKVVCENTDYLSSINKLFKQFDAKNAWKGLGIELHSGALKYYKEKGYIE